MSRAETCASLDDLPRDPLLPLDIRNNKRSPRSSDKKAGLSPWTQNSWNFACPQEKKNRSARFQKQQHGALLRLIKRRGEQKDLLKAREIHAHIMLQKDFIPKDVRVMTALLRMYANCGSMAEAREVFDEIPVRDVVSWTALMSAYLLNNLSHNAMECFNQMQAEGISPNVVSFTCILKACGTLGCLDVGEDMHAEIRRKGLLEKDIVLGNSLVDMYAKCGALQEAHRVFEELPVRDVVTWTSLLAGYAQHGLVDEAAKCFKQMQVEGITPNAVTYKCILKVCSSIKSIEMGEEIFAMLRKQGLVRKDVEVGNTLVDMYAKCGHLDKALEVFEDLPVRDAVSWNALISGYADHGLYDKAIKCFVQMKADGIPPNALTYACVLKACGNAGCLEMGERILNDIRTEGLLQMQKHDILGNALVHMYVKCGAIKQAQEVFRQLHIHDVVTWSSLIAGYAQNEHYDEALKCFRRMQEEGISPNEMTFVCTLKACGSIGSFEMGKEIHAGLNKQGLLEDTSLGNALVDMYAKCGDLEKAWQVFEKILVRDVISWTALISGYVQHGLGVEAVKCFRHMQAECVSPNSITFTCILKACGTMGSLEVGEEIHAKVKEQKLLEQDISLGHALVEMYSSCQMPEKAQEVFEGLPVRNVASWNALIAGYAYHGSAVEAVKCFRQMNVQGFSPNAVTFTCILKACAGVGFLDLGEEVHAEVRNQGLLLKNILLGNTIVDMYAKCGALEKAERTFKELPVRDVVSWSTLMAGYAQMGEATKVFKLFKAMSTEGNLPSLVTFLVLLTACSHAGLLKEGQNVFTVMSSCYLLTPSLEHYTCIIDLLSRTGNFTKATAVLYKLPSYTDNYLPFQTLLGICCKCSNVDLGRWAFDQLLALDEKSAAVYICMESIYTSAGK